MSAARARDAGATPSGPATPERRACATSRTVAAGGSGPRVLVTVHPSALLRLRGKDGWDDAFARLVADLRVAASSAGQSPTPTA